MAKPKKPEPRRSGQIIPRGDKKWLIRVYLGREDDGTRKYHSKTVTGTHREAEAELTKILRELDTQTFVEPSKITLAAFLDQWLETKTDLGPKTLRDYQHRMTKDVKPFIGKLQLDKVTALAVNSTYASLSSERGLSPRTVRYTHSILTQAFKQAIEWSMLIRNPCAGARLPKKKQTSSGMSILTPDQTNTLLDFTARDPLGVLWRTLLTTGMRPQEALALQWPEVDLAGDYPSIQIVRALVETEAGKWTVEETVKTDSSRRRITISQETADALRAHKARQAAQMMKQGPKYARNGFVFATSVGSHYCIRNVRRWWIAALASAGVPQVRLYDARHTHITHLLEAGVHIKAVADRAGHADPNVTLKTYAHVLGETSQLAAGAVESLLSTARERRAAEA